MKGYNESTEQKGCKTTYVLSQDRATEVDESSPRLHVETTISLGNFQFLKLGTARSGEDRDSLKQELLQDLVDLKNEFKRRHKELFD